MSKKNLLKCRERRITNIEEHMVIRFDIFNVSRSFPEFIRTAKLIT
jgi:hypothetical protein